MDADLDYDDTGSGPAVVLLHGHPFDRTLWEPQLGALADRFRLVAPDLRGYGESPVTPGTVAMSELADDVWALLDRLGIETVAVVGLSMGGLVAMEMALGRPERVWALGLVATTAQPPSETDRRDRRALADAAEERGIEALVEAMAPRLFGHGVDEAIVERVTAMMRGTDPHGAAAALRGRAERPDYRDRLRRLAIPSFVCTGTADPWSTAEVTEELVRCLAEPTIVSIPGVGHLPNLEAEERFDAELAAFLAAAAPD